MFTSAPTTLREKLQTQVQALMDACPVKHDNPVGCPLHDIRQRPAPARLDWLAAASNADLQILTDRHLACLRTREFLQCFE